jgi:ABC-type transport system involved in cytochrome bd biosynthesis fused ATPase/permease subunit
MNIALSAAQIFGLLFAAAMLSSLITLLVMHFAFKYRIGPEIERKVDRRLSEGAARLEENLRQRVFEAVFGKSEVIRERARDIAKTGISLLAGRRQTRADYDDEGDF